jgi:small GTP-binding protein
MGVLYSLFFRDLNVCFLGLDNAGKTTILYHVALGMHATTMPTIGFNVETIRAGGLTFKTWDLAGQTNARQFWNHHLQTMDGVVYVVDSQDRQRLELARDELYRVLDDPRMRESAAPLLVFLNKIDQQQVTKEELHRVFDIDGLREDRQVSVCECCAKTGTNVNMGMRWLASEL